MPDFLCGVLFFFGGGGLSTFTLYILIQGKYLDVMVLTESGHRLVYFSECI